MKIGGGGETTWLVKSVSIVSYGLVNLFPLCPSIIFSSLLLPLRSTSLLFHPDFCSLFCASSICNFVTHPYLFSHPVHTSTYSYYIHDRSSSSYFPSLLNGRWKSMMEAVKNLQKLVRSPKNIWPRYKNFPPNLWSEIHPFEKLSSNGETDRHTNYKQSVKSSSVKF